SCTELVSFCRIAFAASRIVLIFPAPRRPVETRELVPRRAPASASSAPFRIQDIEARPLVPPLAGYSARRRLDSNRSLGDLLVFDTPPRIQVGFDDPDSITLKILK